MNERVSILAGSFTVEILSDQASWMQSVVNAARPIAATPLYISDKPHSPTAIFGVLLFPVRIISSISPLVNLIARPF